MEIIANGSFYLNISLPSERKSLQVPVKVFVVPWLFSLARAGLGMLLKFRTIRFDVAEKERKTERKGERRYILSLYVLRLTIDIDLPLF